MGKGGREGEDREGKRRVKEERGGKGRGEEGEVQYLITDMRGRYALL